MNGSERAFTDRLAVLWVAIGCLVIGGLAVQAMRTKNEPPVTRAEVPIRVAESHVPLASTQLTSTQPSQAALRGQGHSEESTPGIARKPGHQANSTNSDGSRKETQGKQPVSLSPIKADEIELIEPMVSKDANAPSDGETVATVSNDVATESAVAPVSVPADVQPLSETVAAEKTVTAERVRSERTNGAASLESTKPKKAGGKVVASKSGKPFFGVGIRDAAASRVTTLYARSTAAMLGVKLGDHLLTLNGRDVKSMAALRTELSKLKVGDEVVISVLRGDAMYELGPYALQGR